MKSFALAVGVASAVHQDRLEQISAIQAVPGLTWKALADPRFASEAPGASKNLCGVKEGWKESIQSRIQEGTILRYSAPAHVEIPENFDAATHWPQCAKTINDIRDQSNCGCCWAFAGASAASDQMCIASNAALMFPLSAEDICFCGADDGCQGGFVEMPWDQIRLHGAVTGGQYQGSGPFGKGMCADFSLPHCHHHGPKGDDPYPAEGEDGCPATPKGQSPQCPTKCDTNAADAHSNFADDKYSFDGEVISASNETSIQQMIMTGGPAETAFTVYSDFENYAGGVYQHVTGDKAGGHAVRMVGWGVDNGVKYWKVANSWNPYWGEKGFFRILRGVNHCGIEDEVVATSAATKWHQGVTPSTACRDQETKEDCTKLPCQWCHIEIFHMDICRETCPTSASDVIAV